MELTRQGADNPEQRIEQDCFNFTRQTLNLSLELILQLMTLVTFAVVLWELSSHFVLPIFGGIAIPGFLMWAVIVYALLGSLATYLVGKPLVRINFMLERYNADFRYRMTRVRENAESIALYNGERNEERGLEGAFNWVYATWWAFMKYTKRLTAITSFYRQAAVVFPLILAAPQYFAGRIAFGVLQSDAGCLLPGADRAVVVRRLLRRARRMEGRRRPAHNIQRNHGRRQADSSKYRLQGKPAAAAPAVAGRCRGEAAQWRPAVGSC